MNSLKRSISTLGRALKRWSRYDVIAIGEVGYVPMAEVGTASTAIDPAKLLAGGPNYLAKVGQSAWPNAGDHTARWNTAPDWSLREGFPSRPQL